MSNNTNTQKTVFVALSGGVDSAVTAALLLEQGYNVVGAHMQNWSDDTFSTEVENPWKRDLEDAKKVCEHLKIPFEIYNFEKEYSERVIKYFFDEYEKGRTPNPDVMCNKEIKFNMFLNKALEEGADLIATGHYAQIIKDKPKIKSEIQISPPKYKLLKGLDPNKDQSYFLHTLSQKQLSKTLFPIGHLTKPEVRELAQKYKLPIADKPDSQGICFLGKINVQEFLKDRLGERKGDIIDIDTGSKVGEHQGSYFFTIGQREGLRIGGTPEPYFVAKTDIEKNIVYVAMGTDNPALYKTKVTLENLHLISTPPVKVCLTKLEGLEGVTKSTTSNLTASIRYRHKPEQVIISPPVKACLTKLEGSEGVTVKFLTPQRAITPGQSLVLYDEDECLGGGVIS